MKKTLFFAALVAAVLPLVNSCGSKDDPVKEEVVLAAPKHISDAVTIQFKSGAEPVQLSGAFVRPEKLILTEGGAFVFIGEKLTKASGDFTLAGTYSGSNGKYELPGIGSLEVKSGSISLTPSGGSVINYEAQVNAAPSTSGNNGNNLVRNWVPSGKVQIEIPSKGVKTSLDPNLESIAKYMKEHDINVNPDSFAGCDIDVISLSMADSAFIIKFKNNTAYVGKWNWVNESAGTFSYDLSMTAGGEMFSSKANGTVEFSSNSCKFSITATAKGTTANIVFTLVPA